MTSMSYEKFSSLSGIELREALYRIAVENLEVASVERLPDVLPVLTETGQTVKIKMNQHVDEMGCFGTPTLVHVGTYVPQPTLDPEGSLGLMLRRYGEMDNMSMTHVLRIANHYGLRDGQIYLSADGKIVVGETVVRPIKFMKVVRVEERLLPAIEKHLQVVGLLPERDFKIYEKVSDVYTSDALRIKSCMTEKKETNYRLYDAMGVNVATLADNASGTIIARSLLWPGGHYDRIYGTSEPLMGKLKEVLTSKGYTAIPDDYTSVEVAGKPGEYFVPYMDTVQFITSGDDSFRFTAKRTPRTTRVARRTDGVTSSVTIDVDAYLCIEL